MKGNIPEAILLGAFGKDVKNRYKDGVNSAKFLTVNPKALFPIDVKPDKKAYVPIPRNNERCPYLQHLVNKPDLIREMRGVLVKDIGFVTTSQNLIDMWNVFKITWNNNTKLGIVNFTAVFYKGLIFIHHERGGDSEAFNFTSSLDKFNRALLSDTPDGSPNSSAPTDKTDLFYGVFEMKLKTSKILYRCPIGGVLANTPDKKGRICEDSDQTIIEDLRRRGFAKLNLMSEQNGKYFGLPQIALLRGVLSGASKFYFAFHKNHEVNDIMEHTLESCFRSEKGLRRKFELYFDNLEKLFNMIRENFSRIIFRSYFGMFPTRPIYLKFKSHNNGFVLSDDPIKYCLPQWFMEELDKIL